MHKFRKRYRHFAEQCAKVVVFYRKVLTNLFSLCIMDIYSKFRINSSGMPIYDQIYTQIKNHIISGEIAEDEPLPSIRALAKDLRISVVTTKRAYEELEREGFIYTQPAKGSFVAPKNIELIKEQNMKKIEEIPRPLLLLPAPSSSLSSA